jgi:hypothetical protein
MHIRNSILPKPSGFGSITESSTGNAIGCDHGCHRKATAVTLEKNVRARLGERQD